MNPRIYGFGSYLRPAAPELLTAGVQHKRKHWHGKSKGNGAPQCKHCKRNVSGHVCLNRNCDAFDKLGAWNVEPREW